MSQGGKVGIDARLVSAAEAMKASLQSRNLLLNHLQDNPMPKRQAVLDILSQIKDLLFPDHRLERSFRTHDPAGSYAERMEKLQRELSRQIHLARSYCLPREEAEAFSPGRAEQDALLVLESLPALREVLSHDVQAALDGDPAARNADEIIFCYPGFEAIATYRIANRLWKLDVPLLPRMMTEYAHGITGTDIHPGATIGRSFFIDHATGVVVGETTIIGENVKLYQGVTLGALRFPKDEKGRLLKGLKRHPTIEDDVVIYAGATVLGGDTVIGKAAVIGGSCWITHSIPAGTVVQIQEPAMKLRDQKKPAAAEAAPLDWTI